MARAGTLQAGLDVPLPERVHVGSGTAIFVLGWCFSADAPIRSLSLVVDGEEQALLAQGMPRLDVMKAMHPGLDEEALASVSDESYRSGFWGVARVGERNGNRETALELRAELEGGHVAVEEIGRVPLEPLPEPLTVAAPEEPAGPLVAIAMATFEPPMELFERQLESIRAQTHPNWVCVISDDCSSPERFAEIERSVAGDARFVVSRSKRRQGFYGNFERALALVPEAAEYVAMADQDDAWHADKLETLLGAIGGAQLVYSDQRIVKADGEVMAETYWAERSNNHTDFLSLFVTNSVTGAASLFPRRLLDRALPFPPAQFEHYHDHWIALVALATGDIAYVDRPLYDYVQHGGAVLGHTKANSITDLPTWIAGLSGDLRERLRTWKLGYFAGVCRLLQVAAVLQERCGDAMGPHQRRVLERFVRADRSALSTLALWVRGLPEIAGRRETLRGEMRLAHAFAWRRALARTQGRRPRTRLRLDGIPAHYLGPERVHASPASSVSRMVVEKTAPLELAVSDDAPQRVNVLIPTIDLEHFFGGYIGKLNLARRLAERGQRVRIVTVDPVPPLPRDWRARVESYSGLAGLFDRVEVEFGRESTGIEVSRSDRFIASTWWTAYVAADAMERIGGGPFLYLIQEYEPFTYPMGTMAAMATESYSFPHRALFSTEFLRDYFRNHGIGVYAHGTAEGDAGSAAFQNAITSVAPPTAEELRRRSSRRLLFYARPEDHAQRNMYDLGLVALARAFGSGAFEGEWEFHGIGTLTSGRQVDIAAGATLKLLRRSEQDDYAELLRSYDVGLSLMYTPHPSLVPIEMASAGLVTVTNSFENKTPEALAEISRNLVTARPTIDGVAAGLREAVERAGDHDARVAGSAVRWSTSWDESFGDALLDWVVEALAPRP